MRGAISPPRHMENRMTQRLLRHKPSGIIYVWQEVFAQRDDFEEIIDVEAKVIDTDSDSAPKRRGRKAAAIDEEALSADASRGLP